MFYYYSAMRLPLNCSCLKNKFSTCSYLQNTHDSYSLVLPYLVSLLIGEKQDDEFLKIVSYTTQDNIFNFKVKNLFVETKAYSYASNAILDE